MAFQDINSLDAYMGRYANILGDLANAKLDPRHVATESYGFNPFDIKRRPFEAQAHVIESVVKTLDHNNVLFVGECGVGKTLVSIAAAHKHADGKGYRCVIQCPPQLIGKWSREVLKTVDGARVYIVDSYRDLTHLKNAAAPKHPEYYVVKETTAKLNANWSASYLPSTMPKSGKQRAHAKIGYVYCPHCHSEVTKKVRGSERPVTAEELGKKKTDCRACGEQLWQWGDANGKNLDRWSVSAYMHKQLKGKFDYAIVDEIHEALSADSLIGVSMGKLVASAKHFIGLTGTLLGGYAKDLRALLWRVSPRTLVDMGFKWEDQSLFDQTYGRVTTAVYTNTVVVNGETETNDKLGRVKTEPGVMPSLFGKHLMGCCVFLSLDEVAEGLPKLDETVRLADFDADLQFEYTRIQDKLRSALASMLRRGDNRLLGKMISVLLTYPDKSHGWEEIGYYKEREVTAETANEGDEWISVVTPKDLDEAVVRPKERLWLDDVKAEIAEDNQVWTYTVNTDKHDVTERLLKLLTDEGIKAAVLKSSDAKPHEREAWIAKHRDCQVVISHPQLVRTGLELFADDGSYNFSSLFFYSTGYSSFTLRQASRRAWRIGQEKGCKVRYYAYRGSMQERCLSLMATKLAAATAVEGKFSEDGLVAMGGDSDSSMELALAKALVEKLDSEELDAVRDWGKITSYKVASRNRRVPILNDIPVNICGASTPLF